MSAEGSPGRDDRAGQRFVRALLPDFAARRDGAAFRIDRPGRVVRLAAAQATALMGCGAVRRQGSTLVAGPEARAYLARGADRGPNPFRRAHGRIETRDGVSRDLGESPLARLALPGPDGVAFLADHHLLAGERVRCLADRARMLSRVTRSYETATGVRGAQRAGPADIADTALDARETLARLLEGLPPDCAGVVLDVCGLLLGLQEVETARGWPRRSAKLVLRIGLEQLALRLGYASEARGTHGRTLRGWTDAMADRLI